MSSKFRVLRFEKGVGSLELGVRRLKNPQCSTLHAQRFLLFFLLSLNSQLLTLNFLFAESFKILGSRPLGMGGAFVAVAEDSLAQYWNPAGIARQKKFDVEIPVGLRGEFTGGILKDVNTVGELADKFSKVQEAQKNGGAIDVDKMASVFQTVATLDSLNKPGKGVLVDIDGGLNLRIMRLAFSVNNFTSVGVTPFVDTTKLGFGSASGLQGVKFTDGGTVSAAEQTDPPRLIAERNKIQTVISDVRPTLAQAGIAIDATISDQELANALINKAINANISDADITSAVNKIDANKEPVKTLLKNIASGDSYSNNESNVTLRGISLTEAAVGYAHRFFVEDLYLGGNLKALVGIVGFFKEEFLKKKVSGRDTVADFDNNTKQTIQPGVDLGLLYDKREKYRFKFGVVGRNLNSPEFDQPAAATGERKFRVQPQARAGIALYPFKRTFWVISSDVDLTSNITAVPGFSSRMWGAGTEINLINSNLFNLGLRAGLMKNLAEENSKFTYTGGLGLKLLHFFLDVSGAVSSQTEEIKSGVAESQKIPQNLQVGVSLGLNF